MVDREHLRRLLVMLESYRDLLAEAGLLDDALARRLTSLAGARNLIVHLYAEVDDERLARSVREGGLDDVDAFARTLAALALRD